MRSFKFQDFRIHIFDKVRADTLKKYSGEQSFNFFSFLVQNAWFCSLVGLHIRSAKTKKKG